MPHARRIISVPFTGVAAIHYFIFRHDANGHSHAPTKEEVEAVLNKALELYQASAAGITPALRLHSMTSQGTASGSHVIRVIPDVILIPHT
jgi:hypothetical protein